MFSFYWEPQGQLSWYLHRVSHMVRVGDLRDGMQKYLHNCSGSFFVSFCLVFEKWRLTYSVKLHKTSRQEDNVLGILSGTACSKSPFCPLNFLQTPRTRFICKYITQEGSVGCYP